MLGGNLGSLLYEDVSVMDRFVIQIILSKALLKVAKHNNMTHTLIQHYSSKAKQKNVVVFSRFTTQLVILA